MSGSHFNSEQLSRYIEAELPPGEAEQLARHLEHCGRCREQLESLRRMLVTLGRLPDLAPSPGFLARLEERMVARRSLWRRLADGFSLSFLPFPARAAALAVVVLMGTGIFWYRGRSSAPLRSGSALRLAKDRQPSSKPSGPAMLAPERGMALQEDLYSREEPAAPRQWFSEETSDTETLPAPARRAERTKELVERKDQLGQLRQPMSDEASEDKLYGEKGEKALLAEERAAPQTRKALSPEVIEGLQALGYLDGKDETAEKVPQEPGRSEGTRAGAFLGVKRVEPEGTQLAFGWDQPVLSESPAPEAAAKALGRQLGDTVRPITVAKAAQTGTQATDMASLVAPEGESPVAGYAGIAAGGAATLFGKQESEAVELLFSSPQPQQTAEALQTWLAERRWSGGQPALTVEDRTAVLTARVAADSVGEATRAILAQANRLTAHFAGQPLAEDKRAGAYYFERYQAEGPALLGPELRTDMLEETLASQLASEATEARRLRRAGRPEVVPAALPQPTYRQIRIRITPSIPPAE